MIVHPFIRATHPSIKDHLTPVRPLCTYSRSVSVVKRKEFRISRWFVDQNHRRRSLNNFDPYTPCGEQNGLLLFDLSVDKSNIDENRALCSIHPSNPEGLVPYSHFQVAVTVSSPSEKSKSTQCIPS